MTWRAIRAGIGIGLMGLLVMAVQVQALECGDTITTDTRLRHHLLNCSEDGLIIGASGITLNLNGKRITGTGNGVGVRVEGVEDVMIRSGKVRNFGTQIMISSSNDVLVRHMVLHDGPLFGMHVVSSNDVETMWK